MLGIFPHETTEAELLGVEDVDQLANPIDADRKLVTPLAELLGDDPAPLLEYPLFSDWGEERISRDRLRAELQSLACRAKGLMNAKLLKGPRHGYINLALAREAIEIFHRSGGTGSVKYAEGKDYGDLLDFTDKMFAVAKRFAPEHPWPKRSTIASFLKKARREEKAREREADLMQKKCV